MLPGAGTPSISEDIKKNEKQRLPFWRQVSTQQLPIPLSFIFEANPKTFPT